YEAAVVEQPGQAGFDDPAVPSEPLVGLDARRLLAELDPWPPGEGGHGYRRMWSADPDQPGGSWAQGGGEALAEGAEVGVGPQVAYLRRAGQAELLPGDADRTGAAGTEVEQRHHAGTVGFLGAPHLGESGRGTGDERTGHSG